MPGGGESCDFAGLLVCILSLDSHPLQWDLYLPAHITLSVMTQSGPFPIPKLLLPPAPSLSAGGATSDSIVTGAAFRPPDHTFYKAGFLCPAFLLLCLPINI